MKFLLIVYDDDAYINMFPIGIAHIASILLKHGIDVEIYNQDVHHYSDEHLTDYLDANSFDFVGLGITGGYYQYRKLLKISQAINNSKKRPFFILGGHGPSPEPSFFLQKSKADAIVIGEGEITIINLINAVQNHLPLSSVKGIAFINEGIVTINESQPLIEDLDTIPWPAYELFPIIYYRLLRSPNSSKSDFVMSILTGRGCKFKCNFCYRMDKGLRLRSCGAVIEEIIYLKKEYGITYVRFEDELFMSSESRTELLCKEFIKEKLNIKWWCNGRLNYAKKNILKLMKEAGCVFVNYGIESMDNDTLKTMNKALHTSQIISGIEATIDAGLTPGYNIIFGNIGENKDTLIKGRNFLMEHTDSSQLRTIRPVTPYPGSPLYYYAIENNLLTDCEDFYENKHVNSDLLSVNFSELKDDEFYKCLMETNIMLVENYYKKVMCESIEEVKKLYSEKNVNFRGFRHN